MSLSQYPFVARSILQLQSWFLELFNLLSSKNYANGNWTPTIKNMTGDPDVTGWYQRFGKRCDFTIIIDGTHSMESAEISLPIDVFGDGMASIYMQYNTSVGTAFIDSSDGFLKPMNYEVENEKVLIQGSYIVDGI